MRIAIGSDHAGFELKEALKAFLAEEHHEVLDASGSAVLDLLKEYRWCERL
jgi:ribose 5-phosphate isomerase RpiB